MSLGTPLTLLLILLTLAATCGGTAGPTAAPATPPALLIVLGNEPLDDQTPTVDMIARVTLAVKYQQQHPGTLLLFTGGATAGKVSEAAMMWHLAQSQGVAESSVRLEKKANSTRQNAEFTAPMVQAMVPAPRPIYIVSKADHLNWALPLFQAYPVFKDAQPLACAMDRQASIDQMQEYLRQHDNPRVRERLQKMEAEIKGVD